MAPTRSKTSPRSTATKKKKSVTPLAAAPKKRAAAKKSAKPAKSPQSRAASIVPVVERALEDIKAVNVKVLDVQGLTDIADKMIIVSGNSDRHVRSIAERVVEYAKKAGYRPMGVEGDRDGDWVLVDLQDVIVHIMLPRIREFYRLEDLWDVSAARREAAQG
jgi:ribosome silencing factor RsfS/YbeB/iojap